MSYFDEDAREMLEVYLLETRQLTEQLNNCLMEAEKNNRFADHITAEMERMEAEEYVPSDIKRIEKQAEEYWEQFCCDEQKKEQIVEPQQEDPQKCDYFDGKSGTIVNVIFEQGCRLENVRAFMLIRQIRGLCSDYIRNRSNV